MTSADMTADAQSHERGDGIRTLYRADLPRVASLVSGRAAAPRLETFLERVLFDQPWADAETPSLVYVEAGEIVGAIGASHRRMRFEGESIRVVVSAFLQTHPDVRSRGVGARLLHALLQGPQDLTLTDGATDTVSRMWTMLGGRAVPLGSFWFQRIFRPLELGTARLSEQSRPAMVSRMILPLSRNIDRLAARAASGQLAPVAAKAEATPLTPAAMLEALKTVAESSILRPDYDGAYLEWLFGELTRIDDYRLPWLTRSRGEPWSELVLDRGRPLGWYVCQQSAAGVCRVHQLAARDRSWGDVLDQLFARAWELGATAVVGRVEPQLVAEISAVRGRMRYVQGTRVLVHARDHRLVDAVLRGDALLTRLDGEWWAA